jgi:hypothetical protein
LARQLISNPAADRVSKRKLRRASRRSLSTIDQGRLAIRDEKDTVLPLDKAPQPGRVDNPCQNYLAHQNPEANYLLIICIIAYQR